MHAIDKKSVYWSSSWARILNVQDIIEESTKETSSNISSTCIPFTTIAGAGQHAFNTCLPSPVLANIYSIPAYDVPRTEDVGLPTKFKFNVGPALQPIAGSGPVNRLRRWPNTNLSPGPLYTLRKHVAFNQCCFNIDPQPSQLARHWNSFRWLHRVFWLLHYSSDAWTSRRQKHQITRYIGPMVM